jgi:hypothetical protein
MVIVDLGSVLTEGYPDVVSESLGLEEVTLTEDPGRDEIFDGTFDVGLDPVNTE